MSKIVTIATPLPRVPSAPPDVADKCADALAAMRQFSADHGVTTYHERRRGINVAHNHNELVKAPKGEWVLVVGYDHTFAPDSLIRMLRVVEENPEVKILMGVTPHCDLPNRIVGYNWDTTGERLLNIVPFRDFHPGEVQSGGLVKCASVGSGFTLFHRELFATIPFPWFDFARRPVRRDLMDRLMDYKGMEAAIESGASDEYLKKQVEVAIRAKARYEYPLAFGPDMSLCLKAADYGYESFITFGTVVYHYDWMPITPNNYIAYLQQTGRQAWEQEFFGGQEMTVDGVLEARVMLDMMDAAQIQAQEAFQKEMEAKEKEGVGV